MEEEGNDGFQQSVAGKAAAKGKARARRRSLAVTLMIDDTEVRRGPVEREAPPTSKLGVHPPGRQGTKHLGGRQGGSSMQGSCMLKQEAVGDEDQDGTEGLHKGRKHEGPGVTMVERVRSLGRNGRHGFLYAHGAGGRSVVECIPFVIVAALVCYTVEWMRQNVLRQMINAKRKTKPKAAPSPYLKTTKILEEEFGWRGRGRAAKGGAG